MKYKAGYYADQGLAFGDIQVFECLAFNTATAVITLDARLQYDICRSGLRLIKRAASGWPIALNLTIQL